MDDTHNNRMRPALGTDDCPGQCTCNAAVPCEPRLGSLAAWLRGADRAYGRMLGRLAGWGMPEESGLV